MERCDDLAESGWPLEGIKLSTIFKVVGFNAFYHDNGSRYTQISVDGFVLADSFGSVLFADVELSEDYGYTERVHALKQLLMPGSLHWIDAKDFHIIDREMHLYDPTFSPLNLRDKDAVNSFFPVPTKEGSNPGDGEFYYAGKIYVPGRGRFMSHQRWER